MTTIIIKYSTTTAHTPAVGSLAQGQLAANIPDHQLWVGNGPANPAVLLTPAGAPGVTGPTGAPGPAGPPGPPERFCGASVGSLG